MTRHGLNQRCAFCHPVPGGTGRSDGGRPWDTCPYYDAIGRDESFRSKLKDTGDYWPPIAEDVLIVAWRAGDEVPESWTANADHGIRWKIATLPVETHGGDDDRWTQLHDEIEVLRRQVTAPPEQEDDYPPHYPVMELQNAVHALRLALDILGTEFQGYLADRWSAAKTVPTRTRADRVAGALKLLRDDPEGG